jgi:hypothetical protein
MQPIVTFKQILTDGVPPQRATRDALGTLSGRAIRYCEPVMAASGFGWYVFPPIGFQLMFDGAGVIWTYDGAEAWYPLNHAAQYPGFAAKFDAAAPENSRGFSPPFLATGEEPGALQIWTGLIARTEPDWSLLLRAPANLVHSPGYHQYEGIIETDRWTGALFFAIRLIHTGVPIHFATHRPFLQVQPVRRDHYRDEFLNPIAVEQGLDALSPADWRSFNKTVVEPNRNPERTPGAYAVDARKRRAAERV